MGTAILGADIVDKGEDIVWKSVIVLEGHLHLESLVFTRKKDDWGQSFLVFVQILHKILNPIFIVKFFLLDLIRTFVCQGHGHVFQEKGWFFQALWDGIEFEIGCGKNRLIRHKSDFCTGFWFWRCTNFFQPCCWLTAIFKALLVNCAITGNLYFQPAGQGVYDWRTYPVETTRGLIAPLAKFTASVEDGEDNLNGRDAHGVLADWHSPAMVRNCQTAILVDGHIDSVTKARKGLIDGVVNDFPDQVMEPCPISRSDIHTGALANSI